MLRGAIDYNDGMRIGGWLHSPEVQVRDRLMLAFVDGQCVGSGHVDRFRQDIADAGLGDGHCGFNFPISLNRADDRDRVYVKLDHSDFPLLQHHQRIESEASPGSAGDELSPETIEWMAQRTWIDEATQRCLSGLVSTGAHACEPVSNERDAVAVARTIFEGYRRGPVRVQQALIRLRNLEEERDRLVEGAIIPILALQADDGEVQVAGQYFAAARDRLLFVSAGATIASRSDATARVYRAV